VDTKLIAAEFHIGVIVDSHTHDAFASRWSGDQSLIRRIVKTVPPLM
jgi:hypothetical protein